ncbi:MULTISPECIES: TetR/AcrR family transcriptional regulator [Niastella]|uniref:TetR/AcrR family transcriptional regulator n=1 Tax=Niastella soli TaxID=2821487 RepID=A0ABS3YT00_9BACT|nr:TetR/AcrR family transcriptional regulator [Niastella soli]MBO9201044.1 TetR/AcrR family transcriptional regulator [Niastella soli]
MTKAERTRHFIVEKAAPIINKKGMAGTSINDIVEATSLTKGSVYGNFESKDEICLEAFDYLVKRVGADMSHAMSRANTSREKLDALFNYYINNVTVETNYGCPIMNFGTEADDTNPIVKLKVNKAILATQAIFAKIIRAGIETGEFKKTVDADAFAIKAFAMIEGGMWIARLQGNPKQMQLIVDSLKQEINDYCQ